MFLILQFGSRKTPLIKDCITACGEEAVIKAWDAPVEKPEGLKGIIFSGSPVYLTEVSHDPYKKHVLPYFDWNIPVLGICFGHQVIGILHGAQIYRGEQTTKDEKITLLKNDLLFEGLGNEFEMGEDHTEGINVPEDFIHLCSSPGFLNEGMKHTTKNIWSVQFHPEISGQNGMVLFRNFVAFCNSKHKS